MKKYYGLCLALSLATLLLAGCPEMDSGNVVYVNTAQISNPHDGTTWQTAYRTIQEGIDAAEALMSGGAEYEVWVKKGVYSEYITLFDGAKVFGNFDGTETTSDDWDKPNFNNFASNPSDYTVLRPGYSTGYHIVTGAGDTTLTGFVIRNGNAYYTSSISNNQNTGGAFL